MYLSNEQRFQIRGLPKSCARKARHTHWPGMNARQRKAKKRVIRHIKDELAMDGPHSPNLPAPKQAKARSSFSARHSALIALGVGTLIVVLGTWEIRGLLSVDSRIIVALSAVIPGAMGCAGGYLAATLLPSPRKKWAFLILFIALFVGGVTLAVFQQYRSEVFVREAKQRHLTKAQIQGLGELADALPKGIRIMVRVPNNSVESQKYGREVWNVLYEHHVAAPLIFAGGEENFVGTWVCVLSALDETGKAGEDFQVGMFQMGMGTRFRDGYWAAADNGFVVWIGTKEPYD
jgi:hypothetical protein